VYWDKHAWTGESDSRYTGRRDEHTIPNAYDCKSQAMLTNAPIEEAGVLHSKVRISHFSFSRYIDFAMHPDITKSIYLETPKRLII